MPLKERLNNVEQLSSVCIPVENMNNNMAYKRRRAAPNDIPFSRRTRKGGEVDDFGLRTSPTVCRISNIRGQLCSFRGGGKFKRSKVCELNYFGTACGCTRITCTVTGKWTALIGIWPFVRNPFGCMFHHHQPDSVWVLSGLVPAPRLYLCGRLPKPVCVALQPPFLQ